MSTARSDSHVPTQFFCNETNLPPQSFTHSWDPEDCHILNEQIVLFIHVFSQTTNMTI